MSGGGLFADTIDALRTHQGDDAPLAEMVKAPFPEFGVSVMTLGPVLPSATVSASGPVPARVDELQLDLGEGPAWDAMRTSQPALEPDVQNHPEGVWPAFSEVISREDVGAIFVFPLRVGPIQLGVLTLHRRLPTPLTSDQIAQMRELADVVAGHVLQNALRRIGEPGGAAEGELFSRRSIHQATGMVIAQAGVSAEDAELVIRAHAFAHSMSMRHVAEEILQRQLTFAEVTLDIEDR